MKTKNFFTPDGKGLVLSKEMVEELKSKEAFDPTIIVTSYKISDDNRKHFAHYLNGMPGEKIIFFNKVYDQIEVSEAFVEEFLNKEGIRNLLIEKYLFPKKNSADFIGIILP